MVWPPYQYVYLVWVQRHVEELVVDRRVVVPILDRGELRVEQLAVLAVFDESQGAVGVGDHIVNQVPEPGVVVQADELSERASAGVGCMSGVHE